METTLEIRDVPDDLYAAIRFRAEQAGLSESDYVRSLIIAFIQGTPDADHPPRPQ